MEKKMFYALSDNCDLSNLYLPNLEAVKEFIESEVTNMGTDDLTEHEWQIKPVFMTQKEFDNLPEYQF